MKVIICAILFLCIHNDITRCYAYINDYFPALTEQQYYFAKVECKNRAIELPFFISLMYAESNFKDNALSSCGAIGACQVMPFHVKNSETLYDTKTNIQTGVKVFSEMLFYAHGDYLLAACYYNRGLHKNPHTYKGWIPYVYAIFEDSKNIL